jgi:hypothetical protein
MMGCWNSICKEQTVTAKYAPSLVCATSAIVLFLLTANAFANSVYAHPAAFEHTEVILAAASCKRAASCEEAVQMWCGGYSRADGDNDGIPCENVCHSLEEVQKIKDQIGC